MKQHDDQSKGNVDRRRFLQLTAGSLAWWMAGTPMVGAQAAYRVGVGGSPNPYEATRRAVDACGEWPAARIAGRTVVIKPNLVNGRSATSGTTTDPQVVRALVDLALTSGAARVLIIEYQDGSDKFNVCGYGLFNNYAIDGRVVLVDLNTQPGELRVVPSGMAYQLIFLPKLLFQSDIVFISAAKLKTHAEALVTLSMKNSFGLTPIAAYQDAAPKGRFGMHKRSVNQSIVDLNLTRPIDFAVVDGVWGMEGNGPTRGTPVRMDMVVAGCNALAVDRVCQQAMGIVASGAQHLVYAARKQLGPAALSHIDVLGDPFTPRTFVRPTMPPVIDPPRPNVQMFAPQAGQSVTIGFRLYSACSYRIEIVRTDEIRPTVTLIRLLRNWTSRTAGTGKVSWDGRDGNGQFVPAGFYTVRVTARFGVDQMLAYATGGVWVAEGTTPAPTS